MALNERLSRGLWRVITISVILLIVGILCQLVGALVYNDGLAKWSDGVDQDDAALKALADREMKAGALAESMTSAFIFSGVGAAIIGLLWSRIPALEDQDVCQECFHAVDKDANFCPECGNELRKKKKKLKD